MRASNDPAAQAEVPNCLSAASLLQCCRARIMAVSVRHSGRLSKHRGWPITSPRTHSSAGAAVAAHSTETWHVGSPFDPSTCRLCSVMRQPPTAQPLAMASQAMATPKAASGPCRRRGWSACGRSAGSCRSGAATWRMPPCWTSRAAAAWRAPTCRAPSAPGAACPSTPTNWVRLTNVALRRKAVVCMVCTGRQQSGAATACTWRASTLSI